MSKNKKHAHKKTYYNDIALRLANKLLGVEHLHYGFFKKNEKATIEKLPAAQETYVDNLLRMIPAKAKTVFDVGCGTGMVASRMINEKKKQVTCLAPDPFLIEKVKENTDGQAQTITDLYENVTETPHEQYDMILMSESAQYVKIEEGWQLHQKFTKEGGYVLISDFFKIRQLDDPYLSKSGHPLDEFMKTADKYGFKLIKQKDITENVAPTMDLYQSIILDYAFPVAEAVNEVAQRAVPRIYKILKYFLHKKVEKNYQKYQRQDAETFKKYKSYYMMLFQKV